VNDTGSPINGGEIHHERGCQTFDFSAESHHFTFSHGASLPDSDKLFNAASKATRGERSIFLRAIRLISML
jgi:hypothetical protein